MLNDADIEAAMREALEPFAHVAEIIAPFTSDLSDADALWHSTVYGAVIRIGYLRKALETVRSLPSAAEAASPTAGWRDIATAERKPDNVIWAAHPGFKPFLAQWTLDTEGACWLSVEGGCDYKPTLWMPVAEPPRAAPTEEARAG